MRYYLAGIDGEAWPEWRTAIVDLPDDRRSKVRVLISYGCGIRPELIAEATDTGVPIFLDSGAFTAASTGKPIDLDAYIEFCQREGHRYEAIAALDVIGDAAASWTNYRRMRDAGIDAIPTFHPNEPWDNLVAMAEDTDYIALGGMVPYVKPTRGGHNGLVRWIARCFQVAVDVRPDIRVHGFGISGRRMISLFPWFSIDSTAWLSSGRFGTLIVRSRVGGFRQLARFGHNGNAPTHSTLHAVAKNAGAIPKRNQTKRERVETALHNAFTILSWIDEMERMRCRAG